MKTPINQKHGQYKTKTYASYRAMIQRCTDENHKSFKSHGARGISICDRWLEPDGQGVMNFLEDMGERPDGMTLDRIDVEGNYCPENCQWSNYSDQNFNQTLSSNNKSGKSGVIWDKERSLWMAYITKDRKRIQLGRFANFEDAKSIREKAELELFGFIKE